MRSVNFLILLFVSCISFTIFYYILMWLWDCIFMQYVIPPFNLTSENQAVPADTNNTWYQLQQTFLTEIDIFLRALPFIFVITVVLCAAIVIYREQAESKEEYYYYGGGT